VTGEADSVRVSAAPIRWSIALGLASLIVLAGVTLLAGWFVLGWFSTLQREVATAIIAGFVAVMVSIVSVLLSKYFDRKREIEQAQRAKKAEIYEELLKFVFSHALRSALPHQVPTEAEGIDFFNRFTQRVIVWGSDDVLRQFAKWKFSMNDAEPNALVFEMEKLFFAIRKDMGHKNAGLRRGDILRIFTPDIEQHL
jgi:hypothetical protein